MNSETQVTLLQRLRNGTDRLVWDEFFDRYWPMVYALARHRGCSEHTAEEVVQDVMLRVFEQRDVFEYDRRRGRFRDWLGTLVRNKVAEHRRRPSQQIRAPGGDSGDVFTEPADDHPEPDAVWDNLFEQSLLVAMLDVVRRETDPDVYLAFELFALQGLRCETVVEATGLSRHAVYRAGKRILKRLQQLAGSYVRDGQLQQSVKEALDARPSVAVQRSLATRIEYTMRSR